MIMTGTTVRITHQASAVGATGGLTITSSSGYVDLESVRFTGEQIGIEGDDGLISLSSGQVDVSAILEVTDDVRLTKTNAALTHTASSGGLKIISTNGYVDVESVRFTSNQIGTVTDVDIITLSTADVNVKADLTIGTNESSVFTVMQSTGNTEIAGTLAVTSHFSVGANDQLTVAADTGNTAVKGTLAVTSHFSVGANDQLTVAADTGNTAVKGTLDVSENTVLEKALQVDGDTSLISGLTVGGDTTMAGTLGVVSDFSVGPTANRKLTVVGTTGDTAIKGSLNVSGATDLMSTLDVGSDLKVNGDMFAVTASDGSLKIQGTMFTVDGGSGDTSIAGDLAVTQSTSITGTLAVTSHFSVGANDQLTVAADTGNTAVKGTLDVSENTVLEKALQVDGAVTMASTLGVTGNTTLQDVLTMSKTTAAVTHNAASGGLAVTSTAGYVDVESVRFTGDWIGTSGDVDVLRVEDALVTIDGALSVSQDLKVNDDMFAVTASDGSLKIQQTMFTVDGGSGDTVIAGTLTAGDTTVASLTSGAISTDDDITLSKQMSALEHTGSAGGGLAISSTNGYVSIAGATGSYVDVESVRITDAKIGLSNDDDIMTLSSDGTTGDVAVAGTLSTSGLATLDSATVTNALGAGATTVSSLTTSGDLLMTEDAAVLTHSAASGTSLAISSTNGYVSIAGATGSYVDVESVRITDAKIGIDGDANIITLTSGVATVDGKVHTTTLETTGAATLDSATVTNTLGAGATTVSSLTTSGDLLMTEDAAVLTHSAASGTSLAISSTNGYVSIAGATGSYVDVESVRITDAKIGVSTKDDLVTLTATEVTVDGKVHTTTLETTGAATLDSATVTNALGAGATTVSSLTTSGDLLMTEDAAVLTHSAASGTSLAISSTNGYVSIAGATGKYVDVESVRFTGRQDRHRRRRQYHHADIGCGDCRRQGAHHDVGDDGRCDAGLGDGDEHAGGRGDDGEQPDDVGRPADDGGCGGADALGGLGDIAGDLEHERVRVHRWLVRGCGVGAVHRGRHWHRWRPRHHHAVE